MDLIKGISTVGMSSSRVTREPVFHTGKHIKQEDGTSRA